VFTTGLCFVPQEQLAYFQTVILCSARYAQHVQQKRGGRSSPVMRLP
jgi:hypothetical protein